MMEEDRSWEIIAQSRAMVDRAEATRENQFHDRQKEHFAEILRGLPPPEIVGFDARFAELRRRAYRQDPWGAAYSCSIAPDFVGWASAAPPTKVVAKSGDRWAALRMSTRHDEPPRSDARNH